MSAENSVVDHSEPVSGVNNGHPTDVKHSKVLRAAIKMSKKAVDNIMAQIVTQLSRISVIRPDQVPEARIL